MSQGCCYSARSLRSPRPPLLGKTLPFSLPVRSFPFRPVRRCHERAHRREAFGSEIKCQKPKSLEIHAPIP
eukprot:206933-Rhodomonas_salina.1